MSIYMLATFFLQLRKMLGVFKSSVVSALQQTEETPDRHHKILEGTI